MAIEVNQGGDGADAIDALSRGTRTSSQGRLQADTAVVDRLTSTFTRLENRIKSLGRTAKETATSLNGITNLFGNGDGRSLGGAQSSGSRNSVPAVGQTTRAALGQVATRVSARLGGGGGGGLTGGLPGGGGGPSGGGGGGGGLVTNFIKTGMQPLFDAGQAISQRVARGAEYSLQADRMSVQLQQMYGMSNSQVRNQLRMPLTGHYLLGGGTAINDLLGMQANTGLTAAKQASTVEALRTVSGFSLGSGDVTRMLSTMASPDVANRMFMMGGTGMYGIGGKERTGMQSIQDIVRRTGLTNPEALKGALQQGSNTRQRLTAMGVPQDMQDMVIQYAMQNTQYQRKTGDKSTMYDPSKESNRETMGIEGSYAVQHEKTTGERLKREESFYGRQTDNFARFEKNLRLSTQMLGAFEDALNRIIGLGISVQGHPVTNVLKYGAKQAYNSAMSTIDLAEGVATTAAGLGAGGDPVDRTGLAMPSFYATGGDPSEGGTGKLSANNEAKLAQLDPRLAGPLRKMLAARPGMEIGDARRASAQQDRSFRARYTRRPDLKEKTKDADRIWNGEVWVYDQHAQEGPPMAPPGQSYHEQGLAADLSWKDKEWVRQNASRFGLVHGGTTKGDETDEPFHVQPAGVGGGIGTAPPGRVSTAGASKASASMAVSASRMPSATGESSTGVFTDSGQRASEVSKAGLKAQFAPIIAGIDKPKGGDPVDRYSGATSSGAHGYTVTIAPNIYLNGTQDIGNDLKRIAREVGKILEQEVSMVMARSR